MSTLIRDNTLLGTQIVKRFQTFKCKGYRTQWRIEMTNMIYSISNLIDKHKSENLNTVLRRDSS
jgi:hypothetical protein